MRNVPPSVKLKELRELADTLELFGSDARRSNTTDRYIMGLRDGQLEAMRNIAEQMKKLL